MSSLLVQVAKRLVAKTYVPLSLVKWIRYELYLLRVRWNNRLNPVQIRKRRRLARMRNVKLHHGCGKKILHRWVNIDGWTAPGIDYVMDLRCRLPFSNEGVSYIFTEHVLEHFDLPTGMSVVREFYRVLAPGGLVRIVVPDLERYCSAYVSADREWFEQAGPKLPTLAEATNYIFYSHLHRFIYDFEALSNLLREVGFRNIVKSYHLNSQHEGLCVEWDLLGRKTESLYLEAEK